VAALPPQPPGSPPPQPPAVGPPGGPPPVGPPQPPYPGAAYNPQTPPQTYAPQPVAVTPVKVHKRTFFLTLAQFIIIVLAIVRILIGLAAAGIAVLFLTGGRARIEQLPGYDQSLGQFGNDVLNVLSAVLFGFAAYWIISGVVDLVLGIIVGRPSNIARWFIVVLDVLSFIYVIDGLAHGIGGIWTLVLLVLLICKVIVFYALVVDAPTRRDFAGTSR
jgi:hypothetical protein